MSRYTLSPAAAADIEGIWVYTEDTWGVEQADQYVLLIESACASVAKNDHAGRSIENVRAGYRILPVGSHFIEFRLVNGAVDIVRVLHQKMDIPSCLQE